MFDLPQATHKGMSSFFISRKPSPLHPALLIPVFVRDTHAHEVVEERRILEQAHLVTKVLKWVLIFDPSLSLDDRLTREPLPCVRSPGRWSVLL